MIAKKNHEPMFIYTDEQGKSLGSDEWGRPKYRANPNYIEGGSVVDVDEASLSRAYSAWANAKLHDPSDTRERLRVALVAAMKGGDA